MADFPPRRILAVREPDGKSRMLCDGLPPHVFRPPAAPGFTLAELWHADGTPKISAPADPDAEAQPALLPSAGGIRARLVLHAPGAKMTMHQTDTIDVVVILSGELRLEIEGAEAVTLKPGDSVVQLGARHSWENCGTEPCVAVVFLVGAAI